MNSKITLLSIALLSSLLVVSCKKTTDPEPNSPPAAFTVTPKVTASGTDVVLTWTKAKDPNGDPVTYAVVYKDTLARNLTDTTYTIKNVGYGTTVAGKVIASDNQKAATSAAFSITTGASPYVLIPDINFEKALITLNIDDVQDGKLLIASALKVTDLDIYGDDISNLQGIESFVNLTYLNCYYNNLTSLDISKNIKLVMLSCSSNQLTNLDLSKNTMLETLHCDGNQLPSLDISKNINLMELYCYSNKLTSLDVSKNVNLTLIDGHSNKLPSLDVSKNVNLTGLDCTSNQLPSLDVSNNIKLTYLGCSSNQLLSLDISKNIRLTSLYCSLNQIKIICVASLSQPTTNWSKDASATYKVCQ